MIKLERTNKDPLDLQPTCNQLATDLISRQAAIDAVEKAVFKGVAKSAIESLPSVEPQEKVVAQVKVDIDEIMERIKEEYEMSEWIPIKERKPDTTDDVLVTVAEEDGRRYRLIIDYTEVVISAMGGNDQDKELLASIVAWRYLPEPYRKEQEHEI